MPNYGTLPLTGAGTGVAATVLDPGDQEILFNAESPTAPQSSIAICRSSGPTGVPAGILFTIEAASGTVLIQGANVDGDAHYQTQYTATNQSLASYADLGNFNFYRAQLSVGTGPVTVIAQR